MIEELIKLSPVPVVFVADDKMDCDNGGGIFRCSMGDVYAAQCGVYLDIFPARWRLSFFAWKIWDKLRGWPRIDIRDSLSYDEKVGSLLHEIGHVLCYKKNCECCRKSHKDREIHACEYALNWILEQGFNKGLLYTPWFILKLSEQDNYHGEAARHTMKSELWRTCMLHIKTQYNLRSR